MVCHDQAIAYVAESGLPECEAALMDVDLHLARDRRLWTQA